MPARAQPVEGGARRRLAVHGRDPEHETSGGQSREERIEVRDRHGVAARGVEELPLDLPRNDVHVERTKPRPYFGDLPVRAGREHRAGRTPAARRIEAAGREQRLRPDLAGKARHRLGAPAIGGQPGRIEIEQRAVLVEQDAAYRKAHARNGT